MDLIDDYIEKMRELQDSLLRAGTDRSIDGIARDGLKDCSVFARAMVRRMEDAAEELGEGVPY